MARQRMTQAEIDNKAKTKVAKEVTAMFAGMSKETLQGMRPYVVMNLERYEKGGNVVGANSYRNHLALLDEALKTAK